jgi:UDP-2,3-diacylglucosamine hydrolase
MNPMINIFISDLHLEQDRPDISELFFSFLQEHTKPGHTLYILGDFFESWIGDDDLTPFNQSVIDALHRATSGGLPIYFMHGNRDFLLGRKFFKATGCTLLPDEYVVNLHGIPTLLVHGDTLCTEDKNYLKFRKKVRNWFVQQLFLWKSLKKRKEMANRYREASKKYVSTAPMHIMDVTQAEVELVMTKHKVQHLIHGHTHREAVHTFELNHLPATRTVLGAWHEHGSALICDETGNQTLIKIE